MMTEPTLFDDKPKRRNRNAEWNALWDTVVMLWHPSGVPQGQKSRVAKLIHDLQEMGATPRSLRRRRSRYTEVMPPGCLCTLEAMVRHWDQLKPQKPRCMPGIDPEHDPSYQKRLEEWRTA